MTGSSSRTYPYNAPPVPAYRMTCIRSYSIIREKPCYCRSMQDRTPPGPVQQCHAFRNPPTPCHDRTEQTYEVHSSSRSTVRYVSRPPKMGPTLSTFKSKNLSAVFATPGTSNNATKIMLNYPRIDPTLLNRTESCFYSSRVIPWYNSYRWNCT